MIYALSQQFIHGVTSPITKIHGSGNLEMNMSMVSQTLTTKGLSLNKIFASHPYDFEFYWTRRLHHQRRNVSTRSHRIVLLNTKMKPPPGHFGLFIPKIKQAKKVTIMVGVIVYNPRGN